MMLGKNNMTFKKYLCVALLVVGAAALISWLYLFYLYHGDRPEETAQPEIGRVYVSNNHGSIVYLTKNENALLSVLEFGGFFCWFIGIFLGIKYKLSPDPLEGIPPAIRYKILHGKKDDPPTKLY